MSYINSQINLSQNTIENHQVESIRENTPKLTSMARLNNLLIKQTQLSPAPSPIINSRENSSNKVHLTIHPFSLDHIQNPNAHNNDCSHNYPLAELSQYSNDISNMQSPLETKPFQTSTEVDISISGIIKAPYNPGQIQINHFIILKDIKKSCVLPLCLCIPFTLPFLCVYYIGCPGCYLFCRQCHRHNHCKICCYNPPKEAILKNCCSKKIFWCPEKYCFDKISNSQNLMKNCCYTHI